MEKEIIKQYTNGELTIVWKPAACIHSRNCWNAVTGMPSVFDPRARPWINMAAGTTEAMKAQVLLCPSGALSSFYNEKQPLGAVLENEQPAAAPAARDKQQSATPATDCARIKILANGPLLVQAEVDVEDASGQVVRKTAPTAFCRCGYSANKPYCDGSHTSKGFQG